MNVNLHHYDDPTIDITKDAFFDGALWLKQPRKGFRAGQDGLLLAASIAKQTKGRVLDFGTGAGIIALALAYRCPGLDVIGVDYDEAVLSLARINAELNGLCERVSFIKADITFGEKLMDDQVDGVIMNPPFYRDGAERHPHNEARSRAMMGSEALISEWVIRACDHLRVRGFFAAMLRPDWLSAVLKVLPDNMGAIQILPIHSDLDAKARRLLIKAIKGRRTPPVLLPPLITKIDGPHGALMKGCLREGKGFDEALTCHAEFFHLAS